MNDERRTEHEENTHSDTVYAWTLLDADNGPESAITAGLLMLQAIARSLAVLADEAEERRDGAPTDVTAIEYAWLAEGPLPEYHREAKRRLRKDWPRLWGALTDAFGAGEGNDD